MTRGGLIISAFCLLMAGFAVGFALRPMIAPASETEIASPIPSPAKALVDARGTQYFVAHIEEARQVIA